jgi:hypothetical protein
MRSKDGVHIPGEGSAFPPWKHLTEAMQHACHPALFKIMHFARYPLAQDDDDQASADVLYEAEDIEIWIAWREEFTKEGAWMSSRTRALIDLFNERRDIDPTSSVLILICLLPGHRPNEDVAHVDIVTDAGKDIAMSELLRENHRGRSRSASISKDICSEDKTALRMLPEQVFAIHARQLATAKSNSVMYIEECIGLIDQALDL